jgi:hypothetical protein
MLQIRSLDAGYPRRPMLPLAEEIYARVENAMRETQSLWDVK